MKILIASDFALLRDGLKRTLAQHFDSAHLGEAAANTETMGLLEKQSWDFLLLDTHLPGSNGFEFLGWIRAQYPLVLILLLNIDAHHPRVVQALRSGVKGYLTRDDLAENLPNAIRKVANGGRYINSQIGEMLAESVNKTHGKELNKLLSERELMIMTMLSQGITPKRIAYDLNLSIKTISTYRGRALKKLNMQSNAEFFRYAIKNDLIP